MKLCGIKIEAVFCSIELHKNLPHVQSLNIILKNHILEIFENHILSLPLTQEFSSPGTTGT